MVQTPSLLYAASLLLAVSPRVVTAWGAMGHEAVAFIASNFVAASTATYFKDLLGDTSANYLATVSTWADSYRYTSEGSFSAPFHYIDANDSPPSSCSLSYSRDCGSEGCVVSALANYTTRLLDARYSLANRQIAAKMIIHFAGDIGQPLHCEGLELGGNGIDVSYDGDDTNLHAVWDSQIPESISGGSSLASARSWATTLTTAIRSGEYASQSVSWVSGLNVATTASRQSTAVTWATDANKYVCSTVLKGGLSAVENRELSGAYTTTAQPVVRLQVAKQGYRLAKYLDAIVAAL